MCKLALTKIWRNLTEKWVRVKSALVELSIALKKEKLTGMKEWITRKIINLMDKRRGCKRKVHNSNTTGTSHKNQETKERLLQAKLSRKLVILWRIWTDQKNICKNEETFLLSRSNLLSILYYGMDYKGNWNEETGSAWNVDIRRFPEWRVTNVEVMRR